MKEPMDFRRTNSWSPFPTLERRDLLCIGMLIVMAVALAPGLDFFCQDPDHSLRFNIDRYDCDVIGQMASYWMLPAMGFLLALRCGALDLSVWMSFSAGSLAAAWLLVHGWPPAGAMAAGIAVGAAMGAANALLVRGSRMPSAVLTLATALAVFLLLRWLVPQRAILPPGGVWNQWHWLGVGGQDNGASHPLFMTRMLLVVLTYGATMLAIMAAGARYDLPARTLPSRFGGAADGMERKPGDRAHRTLALIAGGALAAAGGVFWLLENDRATVPSRPIGDLRVPVAALLAGAWLLKGPGRTLLAGMCLPPAFLLATTWRQNGWGLEYEGYSLQVLLLAAGAGLMALSARAAEGKNRRAWHRAAAFIAGGAMTVWCVSTNFTSPAALAAMRWTGVGLMALGAGIYATAKFYPGSIGSGVAGPDVAGCDAAG